MPVDRREALKKLAAGGAVAGAATAVVSSPAFAANGSPGCAPTVSTYSVAASSSNATATFTVNLNTTPPNAAPTCGCTGAFQTGPTTLYLWNVGGSTSTSQTFVVNPPNANNTPWSVVVTVRCNDRRTPTPRTLCSRVTLSGTVSRNGNSVTFPTGVGVPGSTVYDSTLNC